MKLIYLHGFRSIPHGQKYFELKRMFPDVEVITPDYFPHNPKVAAKLLTQLIDSIDEDVVVIGTSLGGFWARWCAAKLNVKSILINPQFKPYTIPVGQYTQYRTGNVLTVTDGALDQFIDYDVTDGYYVTCIAMDDDLIDIPYVIEECANRQYVKFETGGHRFEDFERLKPIISDMMNMFSGEDG